MKQFLSLAFYAVASLLFVVTAQTPMATLEHEGALTVYNGTGAFAQAVGAAAEGDAIYLGPGHYTAANITKPVTIKGAAFIDEKENGLNASFIDGDLNIELPEGKAVNIEGIYFTKQIHLKSDLKSSLFFHCWLQDLRLDTPTENITIKDCRVFEFQLNASQLNMLCQNSAIEHIWEYSDGTSTLYFKNCTFYNMIYSNQLKSATIENSLVSYSCSPKKGITWINTLMINSNLPDATQMTNCWTLNRDDIKQIWKNDGWWGLTDEAAAKYVGTDGKQIGLYGGSQPFTKTVSGPRITKMEMPAETDENGKISVTITVDRNE